MDESIECSRVDQMIGIISDIKGRPPLPVLKGKSWHV